jgi:hypothetical protein
MLDPLTAASLVGNIVQFVEFATSVLSGALELYKSREGATEANQELENLAKDLRQLIQTTQLEDTPGGEGLHLNNDPTFGWLRQQCDSVASELLKGLDDIKVKGNRRSWKTVKQALLTVWNKNKIDNLQQRLDRISNSWYFQATIRNESEIDQKLQQLAFMNSRASFNRSEEIKLLQANFDRLFDQFKCGQDDEMQSQVRMQLLLAAQKGRHYSAEQSILNELWFDAIEYRYNAVSEAHTETFEWIFEEKESQIDGSRPAVNFAKWLTADESLFWVSGKPGSGKSTLMKFLTNHPTTTELLEQWAGDDKLVRPRFFFWNSSDNSLQKSALGLMRSILFQILCECPDLIPSAFPHLLQSQATHEAPFLPRTSYSQTLEDLLLPYDRIKRLIPHQGVKFCFFIDGLDEYEGEPTDIIKIVNLLRDSDNVKACVSSRSWNEFEAAFGKTNTWKIYIHELTKSDVKHYVEDLLGNDDQFKELQETDNRCPDLVKEIVDAAKGVFLWVFLVVRSLLQGLTNADRIVDLQKRLHEIPRGLEEYFRKIVFDVDHRYQQQMARTFLIALRVTNLPIIAYWIADEVDFDSVLRMEVIPMSNKSVISRTKQMEKRINARCKGVLHIGRLAGASAEQSFTLSSHGVGFLHKSVRDFLLTSDMQDVLQKWSAETFNASLEICQAQLAVIKNTSKIEIKSNPISLRTTLHTFFHTAADLEDHSQYHSSQFSLLDELLTTLNYVDENDKWASDDISLSLKELLTEVLGRSYIPSIKRLDLHIIFIIGCIRFGLTRYVAHMLDSMALNHNSSIIFDYCLVYPMPPLDRGVELDILELLLLRGLFCNESWVKFLQLSAKVSKLPRKYLNWMNNFYDVVKLLLIHGADTNVTIEVNDTSMPAWSIIQNILPQEQFKALQITVTDQKRIDLHGNTGSKALPHRTKL